MFDYAIMYTDTIICFDSFPWLALFVYLLWWALVVLLCIVVMCRVVSCCAASCCALY